MVLVKVATGGRCCVPGVLKVAELRECDSNECPPCQGTKVRAASNVRTGEATKGHIGRLFLDQFGNQNPDLGS